MRHASQHVGTSPTFIAFADSDSLTANQWRLKVPLCSTFATYLSPDAGWRFCSLALYNSIRYLLTPSVSRSLFHSRSDCWSLGHFNFWLSLSLSDLLSETLNWTLKSGLRPKFNLTLV